MNKSCFKYIKTNLIEWKTSNQNLFMCWERSIVSVHIFQSYFQNKANESKHKLLKNEFMEKWKCVHIMLFNSKTN